MSKPIKNQKHKKSKEIFKTGTAIALIVVLIMIILSYYYNIYNIYDFYVKNMRSSLFTAFLTFGSLLFLLKTFIVVKMKENVYDSPQYKQKVIESKEYDSSASYYGPLKRLSHLLYYSVLFSIATSVIQFTIGFLNFKIAAIIGIAIASFTITVFLQSLNVIKENLDSWFDF